jgi:hypothetical protein
MCVCEMFISSNKMQNVNARIENLLISGDYGPDNDGSVFSSDRPAHMDKSVLF